MTPRRFSCPDFFLSGGPQIAFRGGRVDSGEPNASGVPEPQQDLQSHIVSFARQGFTQTEMISLIACGWVLSYPTIEHVSLFTDIHSAVLNTKRFQMS